MTAAYWLMKGDCRQLLGLSEPETIDAIVTDPPYGLSREPDIANVLTHWLRGDDYAHRGAGFMGKTWDSFVPGPSYWKAMYRVLKPGAYLIAFGSTRTVDLLTIAIRLGGFEIRDTIVWLYGSGFPKSLDVSKALDNMAGTPSKVIGVVDRTGKLAGTYGAFVGPSPVTTPTTDLARQWDGYGTALKPGHEPIILARKPLAGTVAANVATYGTGALNIDGCRIGDEVRLNQAAGNKPGGASLNMSRVEMPQGVASREATGRWPANVLLSHTEDCREIGTRSIKSNGHYPKDRPAGGIGNDGHSGQSDLDERHTSGELRSVWECSDDCPVRMLDEQSGSVGGNSTGNGGVAKNNQIHNPNIYGEYTDHRPFDYQDKGGASRFFYCAKASRKERNAGLDGMPERKPHRDEPNGRAWDIPGSHSTARANHHPTVKPIALMRYLVRLVTPPNGIVVDPFVGSGTTGIAATIEGFTFVGMDIDEEDEYLPIAERRIAHWLREEAS